MTVKVLVTALGQQLLASAKQIENKETGDLVGYWLDNPRLVGYSKNDDDEGLSVNFGPYCLVSDEASFSIRAEHVVAILEPREDVLKAYTELVNPEPTDVEIQGPENDATDAPNPEGSNDADDAVGAAGDGAESPSV